MITDIGARMAVESLRSGVPSRHVVEQLGTTQLDIQKKFDDLLTSVEQGQPAEPLIGTASFGQGKSHLLKYLRTEAMRRGFVTSFVVVSPEAPLGNAHIILKVIAENAEVQGHNGVALRSLSKVLRGSEAKFAELRIWARDANIYDRFRALLHIYDEFSSDPELRMQIVHDFEGQAVNKTWIKQKLKELGQQAGYDLQHPRIALLAHERIQVYTQFAVACGAKGLVVFFDELERLAKFTRKQRMAAYSELGWWKRIAESQGAKILPVFAANITQIKQALDSDLPYLSQQQPSLNTNLIDKMEDSTMQEGIEVLQHYSLPLRDITYEDREKLKHLVKDLYSRAYDCQPEDPPSTTDGTTVRSDIRRWITYWDLQRYYSGDESAPEVTGEDVQFDTDEISDDMLPTDNDDGDNNTLP